MPPQAVLGRQLEPSGHLVQVLAQVDLDSVLQARHNQQRHLGQPQHPPLHFQHLEPPPLLLEDVGGLVHLLHHLVDLRPSADLEIRLRQQLLPRFPFLGVTPLLLPQLALEDSEVSGLHRPVLLVLAAKEVSVRFRLSLHSEQPQHQHSQYHSLRLSFG